MIDAQDELRKLEETVTRKPRAKKAPEPPKFEAAGRLRLRQIRSGICTPKDQKATLKALGFRRLGQEVVREDLPEVRGMVRHVRHLVEIVKD